MSYSIKKIPRSREVADGKASLQDLDNLRNEVANGTITPDFYELEVAEVIQVYLNEKSIPVKTDENGLDSPDWSKYGAITVRMSKSKKSDVNAILAYPLESNIKEYPLPGELVVVVEYANRIFYTQKLNRFGSINSNTYSGFSSTKNITYTNYTPTPFLDNENIREVKSEHGDISFNGRFGQSIRLGSNITTFYSRAIDEPDVGTGLKNSPNILIRAGQSHPMSGSIPNDRKWELHEHPWRPVEEDLNDDGSSIWLTTNQPTNLEFSGAPPKHYVHDEIKNGEYKDIKQLGGNQIILNSDRISFNTKKNSILINSTRNISLSAAYDIGLEVDQPNGKIKLGRKDAKEPVLGGDKTMEIITSLCDAIGGFASETIAAVGGHITPVALAQVNIASANLKTQLTGIKSRLNNAKSKYVFVKLANEN